MGNRSFPLFSPESANARVIRPPELSCPVWPFVLSWSLMNVLTCGTTVLGCGTEPAGGKADDGNVLIIQVVEVIQPRPGGVSIVVVIVVADQVETPVEGVDVVASRAAVEEVGAGPAKQPIVALLAGEHVPALAAAEFVVACASAQPYAKLLPGPPDNQSLPQPP